MGSVFGKETVAEPAFKVLLANSSKSAEHSTYEIRRYGKRFVAEASHAKGDLENDNTPFYMLAKYIGVFGTPQNEGQAAISMTAPVAIEESSKKEPKKPEAMAMTAPVVIEARKEKDDDTKMERKKMQFFLPAEYDSLSKIPKPTNPGVTIHEVPPAVGAVHRYAGGLNMDATRCKAQALATQLQQDGLDDLKTEQVMDTYQFWGYNPPYTIPWFRRNEIWVPLTEQQVEHLLSQHGDANAAN